MIVENTFFNVSRMVDKVCVHLCMLSTHSHHLYACVFVTQQLFSWLGALKWLVLRIYWPSNERVQVITSPILIVSGARPSY